MKKNTDKYRQPVTHGIRSSKTPLNSSGSAKKLVAWLRLVYRSPSLIDEFYEPWSYAAQTGFDDACKTLEALHSVPFHLPDDLSIRTLRNMFDAF